MKKVIWAVDPFSKEKKMQVNLFKTIVQVYGPDVVIEPVYLSHPFPEHFSYKSLTNANDQELEADQQFMKIKKLLGNHKKLLPLKIVKQPNDLYQEKVDQLIEYAKQSGADSIALGTHARSGYNRWVLGSFAEKMMSQSEVPLIVINPKSQSWKKINHILFATDFTPESKAAFEQVLDFAVKTEKRIKLFHKLPVSLASITGSEPHFKAAITQLMAEARRKGHAWIALARKKSVKVELILDRSMVGTVSESILKVAKKSPGMIALASEGTLLTRIFVGGSTRKILRTSPFPVWTVRPVKRTRIRSVNNFRERTNEP